ncbi:REBL1 GTPase, partial [Rhabdornis inornatus]|nr:REBL1 GTPase [Rhabdornis inornatus]
VRHRKVLALGYRALDHKTFLAHQFVKGKFVACYEPTVESSNAGVIWGCCRDAGLPAAPATGFVLPPPPKDEYTILPHSFIIGIHGDIPVEVRNPRDSGMNHVGQGGRIAWVSPCPHSFQVVQTLHNKLYKSPGKTWVVWALILPVPMVLVGHKADLALLRKGGLWGWEVRIDEGKKPVESWGAIFLKSSAEESQVTVGISMKLTEENNRVDNSYGRSTSCHLM